MITMSTNPQQDVPASVPSHDPTTPINETSKNIQTKKPNTSAVVGHEPTITNNAPTTIANSYAVPVVTSQPTGVASKMVEGRDLSPGFGNTPGIGVSSCAVPGQTPLLANGTAITTVNGLYAPALYATVYGYIPPIYAAYESGSATYQGPAYYSYPSGAPTTMTGITVYIYIPDKLMFDVFFVTPTIASSPVTQGVTQLSTN